jgi:mono/diheme cytochrome c family protein
VARGARLVEDNGCSACHSAGNEVLVGPAWGQLYGSDVTVDDAFLTRAILDPDAQIAAGFDKGVMPPYADLLETEQVAAIVAYIRSLGGEDQ